MDTIIKAPQALKAKVMLWTDVTYHDMEEIDKIQSIPDLESAFCSVLGVDLPEPRKGVLLELYVQTVLFCREHSFSKEQTSALLSIIKSIHEANVETPLNNSEECFKYCRELLLCHSVRVKLDLSLSYSGPPTVEDSSVPAVEDVTDTEAVPKKDGTSSETQQASITAAAGVTSELKALIEQEVREHMTRVSGQLDQRIKEIASQHSSALDSSQNHKAKK
ncbi:cilia- and flagella-associated protein 119 isoform X6 [Archocentrus centrarchus]|uniref:cilia- and flagella-associated protein 119 isoform X6 n=1 Tax=Archocentrus centrarchus TaxID=63155 RepID=UPI0011EA1DA3|nr:coiled-coil domain-containing protein 189 isoform X6 [Archocentrus centrarchus]